MSNYTFITLKNGKILKNQLINKKPTNKKIEELNNLLPHNGRWHTVYEEDDVSIIDGIPIIKKEKDSMT